jgi:hypothetical protein
MKIANKIKSLFRHRPPTVEERAAQEETEALWNQMIEDPRAEAAANATVNDRSRWGLP